MRYRVGAVYDKFIMQVVRGDECSGCDTVKINNGSAIPNDTHHYVNGHSLDPHNSLDVFTSDTLPMLDSDLNASDAANAKKSDEIQNIAVAEGTTRDEVEYVKHMSIGNHQNSTLSMFDSGCGSKDQLSQIEPSIPTEVIVDYVDEQSVSGISNSSEPNHVSASADSGVFLSRNEQQSVSDVVAESNIPSGPPLNDGALKLIDFLINDGNVTQQATELCRNVEQNDKIQHIAPTGTSTQRIQIEEHLEHNAPVVKASRSTKKPTMKRKQQWENVGSKKRPKLAKGSKAAQPSECTTVDSDKPSLHCEICNKCLRTKAEAVKHMKSHKLQGF